MVGLRSFMLFSLFCTSESSVKEEVKTDEEFSEALLLRPLPDRKELSHFHFQSTVPPTHSYIALLVQVHKFHIREMELSFTQGRWNYERWGGYDPISSSNGKPPGVELLAVFYVPQDEVDACWKNLTHALSGLFCFNQLPWAFNCFFYSQRQGWYCSTDGSTLYPQRILSFSGYYHLTSAEFGSTKLSSGIVLDQTLTVVLQPNTFPTGLTFTNGSVFQPDWSLSSLFGRKVPGKCVLSKSSNVYVQFEQNLVSEQTKFQKGGEGSHCDIQALETFCTGPGFEMSISPNRIIKEVDSSQTGGPSVLYEFSVDNYSNLEAFDLGIRWKLPLVWSYQQAPLSISRYLMGSGNERGSITISFKSTGRSDHTQNPDKTVEGCRIRLDIFQVVPCLPCGVKTAGLILEFDKHLCSLTGVASHDEYPPDANQGFDITSSVVVFSDFKKKRTERNLVLSYTLVLLVPLTTPDFSMPNAITCTVFALYFGSLLNALRRRLGQSIAIAFIKIVSHFQRKTKGTKETFPPSSSSVSPENYKLIVKKVVLVAV
ncbi:hypothetical protein M9H77_08632 [Catharanthus roseus]|uniref:Uncharacterized protein n=1 Tax=Catharanthus roseus TaxID=4058 RepID=A0ACC0BYK4_CATRO|nr:hypothetical protein M9H77_08632 [Catharanthus roseus]